MSSYSSWMPAIVGFVQSCKWTQLSLFFLRRSTFESTVSELSQKLFIAKLSVVASMNFDEDDDDASMSTKLQVIQDRRSSKVVVAMALESTYWKIALTAQARGMISGWCTHTRTHTRTHFFFFGKHI
jgi:hypothetical protein